MKLGFIDFYDIVESSLLNNTLHIPLCIDVLPKCGLYGSCVTPFSLLQVSIVETCHSFLVTHFLHA